MTMVNVHRDISAVVKGQAVAKHLAFSNWSVPVQERSFSIKYISRGFKLWEPRCVVKRARNVVACPDLKTGIGDGVGIFSSSFKLTSSRRLLARDAFQISPVVAILPISLNLSIWTVFLQQVLTNGHRTSSNQGVLVSEAFNARGSIVVANRLDREISRSV